MDGGRYGGHNPAREVQDMMRVAELRCRCGQVRGRMSRVAPETVNRVTCYCQDCQAFLHHLGRADLLDARGGSDIVQMAPAALVFTAGMERIAGLRLTPKGLYRWYAACCGTPLGNAVGPAVPFIGVVTEAFAQDSQWPDNLFGKPVGGVHGQSAVGGPPPGTRGIGLRLMLRAIRLVLGWWLGGRVWPHPFFDRATRRPVYPVTLVSPAERAALRPLCGPLPSNPSTKLQH